MDLYQATFIILVITSCCLAWTQHKYELWPPFANEIESELREHESHGDPNRFRKIFIPVYLLVMASDWLQGAYVYTLYKDEKGLTESVVAALFTSGFLAAAISALFVGKLADRYGRRLACLVFCATYAVSCLTKISNNVVILFIGRLLGGLSTTLMYSVFESWMVTEYYAQQLEKSSMSLSAMFGMMTTLNSIVAIVSGVVGESLVAATGTKVSPFMAAVVCLGLASRLMVRDWTENYGDSADLKKLKVPAHSTLKIIWQDKRILVLGFISCCCEGSMYIFVFYWSAAMEHAHGLSNLTESSPLSSSSTNTHIPFGVIFATFMAAMMLGSLLFSHLSSIKSSSSISITHPTKKLSLRKTITTSTLLTGSILISSTCLLVPTLFHTSSFSEIITFWSFCIFEATIGIYYPSIGAQKGLIVADGVRANIYGVLRIPLNIFVVVALTTTVEGIQHMDRVFLVCGGLLLGAGAGAGCWLDDGDGGEEEPDKDLEARIK